ncbi:MAG: hypothetical protein C3F11_10200 [Methylocystaceae bacterium]|nr:MAG: hypothetical protein C3F11_10200 [Methylocystaceae bacterium]
MSNRRAILLFLPALFMSAASALAAPPTELEIAPAVSAAAAHDHAAMPTGCNGCVGHDCAGCPLAMAAAEAQQTAPSPAAEIRCGAN